MGIIKAAKLAFDYLRYDEDGNVELRREQLMVWIWTFRQVNL